MLLILLACTGEPEPDDSAVDPVDTSSDTADTADTTDTGELNLPPSEPVISITPEAPLTSDLLTCNVVEPGVDPELETVIHQFAWARNGEDANEHNDTITALKTSPGDSWICQVTAWDGQHQSEPVQATVTIAAE